MEAGPVEALGLGVDLAVVDARVEVAERLGHGLDALVVRPHVRELGLGGRRRRRSTYSVDEPLGRRHELGDLVLDERGVQVDRLLLELGIRPGDRDAVAGDRERRLLPTPVADHPRLAQGDVAARLDRRGQRPGRARSDVLDLADDPQPVVAPSGRTR